MLRIFIKEKGNIWEEIPNGPFPIEKEQLKEARRIFFDHLSNADSLASANTAPQTLARDILFKIAPKLNGIDRSMLSFAVICNKKSLKYKTV